MPASSFVPTEEIRQLTYGSYEHLRSRIEAVLGENRVRLFGSETPVQILGTFSGYAVVLSEDANVYRVKYQEADSGELKVVGAEKIGVPVYSSSNMEEFLVREAKEIVGQFLGGRSDSARERLRGLAQFARETTTLNPEGVVEAFGILVRGERPWKRLFVERAAQIRATLDKAQLKALDESVASPKFSALYNGTIAESQIGGYRDLVLSDINYVSDRLDTILASTREAIALFNKSGQSSVDDPAISMFDSFAQDFVSDVGVTRRALSEARGALTSIVDLAKIYDVVAEAMNRYDVASVFVGKMSRRLTEAQAVEGK